MRREQRVSGRLRQWWPLGAAWVGRGRGHQSGIQLHPNSVIVLWGHVTSTCTMPCTRDLYHAQTHLYHATPKWCAPELCNTQLNSEPVVPCHLKLYLSLESFSRCKFYHTNSTIQTPNSVYTTYSCTMPSSLCWIPYQAEYC